MSLSEENRNLAIKAAKKFPSNIKGTSQEFQKMEEKIGLKLSKDFKEIYLLYPYDLFKNFEFNSFPEGCIEETLRLRENAKLPVDSIMLSEDDASIILLKCYGDYEEVYWIAIEDYENYCNNDPLIYNPTIFSNFPDFFKFLLND
jgi:hypothetical protein